MLCYQDRTFCSYYQECVKGKECSRALTEEVERAAARQNLLICKWSVEPECFEHTTKSD